MKDLLKKTSVFDEESPIEFQDSFDDTADDEPEDISRDSSKIKNIQASNQKLLFWIILVGI